MEFDFTGEQYALRDVARDVFARSAGPARLRAVWDADGERDGGVWRALASVGLTGLTVAGEHDGSDGDLVDLALVAEEAGRAALPEPLTDVAAVATFLLEAAGDTGLLRRVASGDALVVVAARGAPFVQDADLADLVLWQDGDRLHPLAPGNFHATRIRTEDRSRRMFALRVTDPGEPLDGVTPEHLAVAFDRGAAATACVLNGIAVRLCDTTVAYVGERRQFGRPVGSFQAVKHRLADAHVQLESSRAAAWYACYALARGLDDAPVAASAAKAAANDACRNASLQALQCHGGIGFTWEHDLHLWMKRGAALEAAWGTGAEHRARLAAHVLDGPRRHT